MTINKHVLILLASLVSATAGAAGHGRNLQPFGSLGDAVNAARADALKRAGSATDKKAESKVEPKVVSSETVLWRDGSLGCPTEGMNYTQALVPGYRVRLQMGAELLDYHASRHGVLLLCPAGKAIDPQPDSRA